MHGEDTFVQVRMDPRLFRGTQLHVMTTWPVFDPCMFPKGNECKTKFEVIGWVGVAGNDALCYTEDKDLHVFQHHHPSRYGSCFQNATVAEFAINDRQVFYVYNESMLPAQRVRYTFAASSIRTNHTLGSPVRSKTIRHRL